MGRPLLGPATIRVLTEVARDGWLTKQRMLGSVAVRIARWDAQAQDFLFVGETPCVRENETPGSMLVRNMNDGSDPTLLAGTLVALAPWDVRVEDRFSVDRPDGTTLLGEVAHVAAESLGIQRVAYRLRDGGA